MMLNLCYFRLTSLLFFGELILSISSASKVLIGVDSLSHGRRGTSAFIPPTMDIWKWLNVALVTAFVFLVDFTPGGRENCAIAAGLIESNQNADCGLLFFFFPFPCDRYRRCVLLYKDKNERKIFMCADRRERAHPRPPTHVLFHRLQRFVQGRHQLLWKTGKTRFTHPQRSQLLSLLQLSWGLVSSSLQGIQFYTQIKTVTSQWKAEDATVTTPAVTMPTMGR